MPWTLYAMWVIAAIGIPSNILTLVILLQPSMRIQSTFMYLVAIAVADTGVLVFWLLGDMNDYDIVHLGDKYVSNIWISKMFCQLFSSWLLGASIIDRYITTRLPLCASVMCDTARELIVIAVIVIICGAIITFRDSFATVPFVVLFALIAFMIYKTCNIFVTRESAESEQMKTEDGQRHAESRTCLTELQILTLMLLITTFSFLILTLPFPTITFMPRYMYVEVGYVFFYSSYAVKMYFNSLLEKGFREKMVNLLYSAFRKCNLLSDKEVFVSCLQSDMSHNVCI